MRFDAYAGNVREVGLVDLAQCIGASLGGMVVRANGRRRYGDVLAVEVGGREAAWCGLDTGNDLTYFEGKGETSPDLVACIRRHFPGHTVSRVDVCEDFDAPGAFDALVGLVRQHKGPRVKGRFVELPDEPEDGRTWAAGQRKGGVSYIRVYEAGKMRERLVYGRPHWTRLELECKPQYAADKEAAASMEPLAVWGFSAWSRRVAEAVAQVEVPRYAVPSRQYSADKTTEYLARTFRRHWEEMLADYGDWENVGRMLAQVWAADDEADAARRGAMQ